MGDALNAEWAQLLDEQQDVVAVWAAADPSLERCRDLSDVLSAVALNPDAALTALLKRGSAGDGLAYRVVLQAMLGRLVRMAARDPRAGVDDYVAALWLVVATYPLASRPSRVAANLALDTLKAVRSETRWLRRGEVRPYPPGGALDDIVETVMSRHGDRSTDHDELTAPRLIRAAGRLGFLDPDAESVLFSVYAEGLSGREAAARHGRSPSLIRYQCSKGVARLARRAMELAEAA